MNDENLLKRLKNLIKNKNEVILIIAGKNSYFKSGSNLFFKRFFKNNNVEYYFKKKIYPEIAESIKIAKKIDKLKPSLIFAIGGGSVIDLAKVANIINIKKKFTDNNKIIIKKKFAKLVAVPLTSGSGAETTSSAVLYIGKKKISIENNGIKPDHFFLIPELTKNAPKIIKGPSIFDCIAQAVESIFSLKSNSKSILYASRSLKISLKNYLNYYKKPNISNSKKMLLASNLSGKAINISRTIAPHAISYPFTSLFGISHGKAVAISFVSILKYNFLNKPHSSLKKNFIKNKYKLLFHLTKTKNIDELAHYFDNVISNLEIKTEKNNLKINFKKNWPKIKININSQRLANNPSVLNVNKIRDILDSCL